MRALFRALALRLPIVAALIAAPIHMATFVAFVSFKAVLLPLAMLALAGFSFLLGGNPLRNLRWPSRNRMVCLGALVAYAIAVSVAYVIEADGASRAAFIDGHWVAMYQRQILRVITEDEARQFPNLWTRVTCVWLVVGAALQATLVDFAGSRRASGESSG